MNYQELGEYTPATEKPDQDINDPVWPSDPVEAPALDVPAEGPEIRGLHGHLDLLQHVAEEGLDALLDREHPEGTAHRPGKRAGKPMLIPVVTEASESWRGNTYFIKSQAGTKIAVKRSDRYRLVVKNMDATNVIFLAHDTVGTPGTFPQANMISVRPLDKAEFHTRGEIWAFPFADGTAQQIDVQDEYGFPQ